MPRESFRVAKDVLTTLGFYREHYASGPDYQTHKMHVVGMLRKLVEKPTADVNFLTGFADLLEKHG